MDWLILAGILVVAGIGIYFVTRKKAASVADITKPLNDIVNKLHEHVDDQHDVANKHEADAAESTRAAGEARKQRDHARHVAIRIGQLVTTPATVAPEHI